MGLLKEAVGNIIAHKVKLLKPTPVVKIHFVDVLFENYPGKNKH